VEDEVDLRDHALKRHGGLRTDEHKEDDVFIRVEANAVGQRLRREMEIGRGRLFEIAAPHLEEFGLAVLLERRKTHLPLSGRSVKSCKDKRALRGLVKAQRNVDWRWRFRNRGSSWRKRRSLGRGRRRRDKRSGRRNRRSRGRNKRSGKRSSR
jgi:hypothetical protein